MTGLPIVTRFSALQNHFPRILRHSKAPPQTDLHTLWLHPRRLPRWAADSPTVLRTLDLLGPLPWDRFPDRDLQRNYGRPTVSYAAFAAACLLQLNEHLFHMSDLRTYLREHPAFIWLLGLPLAPDPTSSYGFDPDAGLPAQRHLTRMLRTIPNEALQFLLAASVSAILAELHDLGCTDVAQCVSLDTKHILAWVKENNPKAYVSSRFDKSQQPTGDPDCRLGCKRRHNQRGADQKRQPPRPKRGDQHEPGAERGRDTRERREGVEPAGRGSHHSEALSPQAHGVRADHSHHRERREEEDQRRREHRRSQTQRFGRSQDRGAQPRYRGDQQPPRAEQGAETAQPRPAVGPAPAEQVP